MRLKQLAIVFVLLLSLCIGIAGNVFGATKEVDHTHMPHPKKVSLSHDLVAKYKMLDVVYWQQETKLPMENVQNALSLSRKYAINPQIVFRQLALDMDFYAIEEHIIKLVSGYALLDSEQKNAVPHLIKLYDAQSKIVQEWVQLGATPQDVLYLLYFNDIFPDSLEGALFEAKTISWDTVHQEFMQAASEFGLSIETTDSIDEEELDFSIRSSTYVTTLTNPATGYDSGKLNPFQSYFTNYNETVSPASGALNLTQTDLVLPGRAGLDLAITRIYSSNAAALYQQNVDISYDEYCEEYWCNFCEEYQCDYYETWYTDVTAVPTNYLHNRYGLGAGWSFGLPSVESVAHTNSRFLHMGDGRIYLIDASSPSGLANHTMRDMIFEADTTIINNVSSTHALKMKDGTNYYFGSYGQLLGIRDRYLNEIKFTNQTSGIRRIVKIEDTVGRTVNFTYSTSQVKLDIKDNNGVDMGSLIYELSSIPNTYSSARQLSVAKDLMGRNTLYNYTTITTGFGYEYEGVFDSNINKYLALTKVTHPFGTSPSEKGSTHYTWEVAEKLWIDGEENPSTPLSDKDYQEFIRITSRNDAVGALNTNKVDYSYIPWGGGVYKTRQIQGIGIDEVTEILEFNAKHLMIKKSSTWTNPGVQGSVTKIAEIEYYLEYSPSKETVYYAHAEGDKFVTNYGYDDFGNLLYLFDSSGKRSEYSYHPTYHLPKEKRDLISPPDDTHAGIWHQTKYTVTADYKSIIKETHQEVKKTLGSPTTLSGTTSSRMKRGSDWRLPMYNSERVDLRVDSYVGWFWNVRYNVEKRQIGTDHWDSVATRYYKTYFSPISRSDNFSVLFSPNADWEVRVVVTSGGDAQVISSSYRAKEETLTSIDSVIEYEYEYFSNGTLKNKKVKMEDGKYHVTNITYETKYNAYPNKITKSHDGVLSGKMTTATYDYFGRIKTLTETENSIAFTQEFTYDKLGRLTHVKEPLIWKNGVSSQYYREWQYNDGAPNVIALVRKDLTVIDKVTYRFDGLGRLLSEFRVINGQDTKVRDVSYTDRGQVKQETSFGDTPIITSYTYDPIGRVLQTIQGNFAGPTTVIEYIDAIVLGHEPNSEPNQIVTNTRGHSVRIYYDAVGRTIKTEQDATPEMYSTIYSYDLLDRLLSVKDPGESVTTYTYDIFDWIKQIDMPVKEGGTVELASHVFGYDKRGNMLSANYGTGDIAFNYDVWDRNIEVVYPLVLDDGYTVAHKQQVTTTYQHFYESGTNGKQVTATTKELPSNYNSGEVLSVTDPLGRLVSEQWGIPLVADGALEPFWLAYEYNGIGNMTKMTFADNHSVNYNYYPTSYGRLEKVQSGLDQVLSDINYTTNGFIKGMTYGTGTPITRTTITPDLRNRPGTIETKIGSNTIFKQVFEYDGENNINYINKTQPNQEHFTYDPLHRLITAKSDQYDHSYVYDGSGNRIKLVDLISGITSDYHYNTDHGHLLTGVVRVGGYNEVIENNTMGGIKTRIENGVTTSYLYDGAGRLKEVREGTNTLAIYTYDAYGRLVKTKEGDQVTVRLPKGNETAYEKVMQQGSPTIERRYIVALGRYIAREEIISGVMARVYYHGDHLGSTRILSGTDTGSFTYDPFGNVVQALGDAPSHSHRFTGKPVDGTGLSYFGARFYDSELGRFINVDPARDGLNWYVYCYQNPLKYVDVDGLKAKWSTVGWGSVQFIGGFGQVSVGFAGVSSMIPPLQVLGGIAMTHGAANMFDGRSSIVSGFQGGELQSNSLKGVYESFGASIGSALGDEQRGAVIGGYVYTGVDLGISIAGTYQGLRTIVESRNTIKGYYALRNNYWVGRTYTGPVGVPQLVSSGIGLMNDVPGYFGTPSSNSGTPSLSGGSGGGSSNDQMLYLQ